MLFTTALNKKINTPIGPMFSKKYIALARKSFLRNIDELEGLANSRQYSTKRGYLRS